MDFTIHRGCKPPFTETWVFVSNSKVPFNAIEMEQYLDLTFAETREDALRYFPRHDGALSLGLLRRMFSDYVIVGKLQTGEIWDISRTGMIKNTSEFKEFLFSQNMGSLGSLGGTPASRALERASSRAAVKAKAKASAATRRRDACVTACFAMYTARHLAKPSRQFWTPLRLRNTHRSRWRGTWPEFRGTARMCRQLA